MIDYDDSGRADSQLDQSFFSGPARAKLTEFSQKWATVKVTSAACKEVWYGFGAAGSKQ